MKQKKNSLQTTHYKLRTRCVSRGVTLIDTLVGTALMLVIFLGIAGAIQLSLDVVTNNKARAGAVALANERMEYIRSLAYASVGTVGGIPSGTLAQTETTTMNGITYTRRTFIEYSDDSKDGTGGADTNGITADYKAAKVSVSWTSRTGERSVAVVTRIESLNGMEIACTPPCGTLALAVVDSQSQPVSNAQVAIVNSGTGVNLNTYSDTSGIASFIGSPAGSGYQITVTKAGYSTSQTYSTTAQNTSPNPAHLTVADGQTTSGTFAIDWVSILNVTTYSRTLNTWTDSFANENNISPASTNIEASGNRARFAGSQPWVDPAQLFSVTITPTALSRWGAFSWNDTMPAETTITYHVYYPVGSDRALVPDNVLSGNSAGFTANPIDVSSIPAATYPSLILEAYLVALNPSAPSPSIEDWSLTYESGAGVSVPFTLRGSKTIGSGPNGTVYKYDQSHTTSASGTLSLNSIEWDSYDFTVGAVTGYDIASFCVPKPMTIAPNTTVQTTIHLEPHTTNALLVEVKSAAGALLSGAKVWLTKGGSYDKTLYADSCGNSFFSNLTSGAYDLVVSMSGYATSTSTLNVSGTTPYSITLE